MTSTCIETTCPYCGVGCGVTAQTADNAIVKIEGSPAHPANSGKLCIKGTNLAETSLPQGRLLYPMINGSVVSWDQALDLAAAEFKSIVKEHGPKAIAFYLSGQLLTEDYYVANKLMKGFIGSANVDTNSRLCMASAVAAHKRAFGEDVVPCRYTDIDHSDLIVLTGSNTAWAHPIVYQRIVAAKQQRGTKVVVIDPRRTTTCDIADLHLPLAAGSDGALFNGLLNYLIKNNSVDQGYIDKHTEGFAEAVAAAKIDPESVARLTGLKLESLNAFYELFASHDKTLTLFSQGVNQSGSGTDKGNAIINCHLATGRIGKPGQGPFSITGQPNAMGGREVGGMANQLAAHMDFNDEHLDRVQRFWQAPNLVNGSGLKAVDMFEALGRGEMKAIWIMGTNPAVSLPDSNRVRQALDDCPFVVVSDCIEQTDTNRFANLLLPAQGWGEKDGTVTNSERCISRQRRILEPQASALADWEIICRVARKMGFSNAFEYSSAGEIFAEHARLSGFENNGERLFDISHLAALTPDEYETLAPSYWPQGKLPFQDGRYSTASGKAQFIATSPRAPGQKPNSAFPLILNTGRVRDQWHTMSRTGMVPKLFGQAFSPYLQIHPGDADKYGIAHEDLVQVKSDNGSLRLLADVNPDTQPGLVFAPIHWNDQFAYRANVSQVVAPVTDPVSGQPESKHAAVSCERIDVGDWVRLITLEALDLNTLNTIAKLKNWVASPIRGGWQYEIAMDEVEALLDKLAGDDIVSYTDTLGGIRRLSREAGRPNWLLFANPKRQALPGLEHMASQFVAPISDWQRLSPFPRADQEFSAMICSCFEVREAAIRQKIETGTRTARSLGKALGCGTNCGSCVGELNHLIADVVTNCGNQAP
jgi:assimilatory nitrate reductase catalytic subunit